MRYNEYSYQEIKKLIEGGQTEEHNENSACLGDLSKHEAFFVKLGADFPDFKIGEVKDFYRLGITDVEDDRYISSYDFLAKCPERGVAVLTSAWMDGLSKAFCGITDNMVATMGVYKIKGWVLPARGMCGELLIIPMDWAVKTDIGTVEELKEAIKKEEEKNELPENEQAVFVKKHVYSYINMGHKEYVQGIEMYNLKRPAFMDKSSGWIELMNRKKIYLEDYEARDWLTFVNELTWEMYSSVKVSHFCYSNGMTVVPLSHCIISRIHNIWDAKCVMKNGEDMRMNDFYNEFGAYDNAEEFLKNVEALIEDREQGVDIYGNKIDREMPAPGFCQCRNLEVIDAWNGFYICRKECH